METAKRQFNPAASEAIAHLKEREKALEPFGWTGMPHRWIALACLHGGVFTRAQLDKLFGCHPPSGADLALYRGTGPPPLRPLPSIGPLGMVPPPKDPGMGAVLRPPGRIETDCGSNP